MPQPNLSTVCYILAGTKLQYKNMTCVVFIGNFLNSKWLSRKFTERLQFGV